MHNETLSVAAMCVNDEDVPPLESTAETQPQLPTGSGKLVSDDLPVFHWRHDARIS
jgi:hypothetical protein